MHVLKNQFFELNTNAYLTSHRISITPPAPAPAAIFVLVAPSTVRRGGIRTWRLRRISIKFLARFCLAGRQVKVVMRRVERRPRPQKKLHSSLVVVLIVTAHSTTKTAKKNAQFFTRRQLNNDHGRKKKLQS